MVFKINVSHNGKTFKLETESEVLVGKSIGETFNGEDVDAGLKGFEIEITGHSDLSGIPGFKGLEGNVYHRRLLTYGSGMKDRRKGMRLRKTNRGEEISLKTHQINSKVVKEGDKGFEGLFVVESGDGEEKVEEKKE
jgi:ribosomal protein S6E (S10)